MTIISQRIIYRRMHSAVVQLPTQGKLIQERVMYSWWGATKPSGGDDFACKILHNENLPLTHGVNWNELVRNYRYFRQQRSKWLCSRYSIIVISSATCRWRMRTNFVLSELLMWTKYLQCALQRMYEVANDCDNEKEVSRVCLQEQLLLQQVIDLNTLWHHSTYCSTVRTILSHLHALYTVHTIYTVHGTYGTCSLFPCLSDVEVSSSTSVQTMSDFTHFHTLVLLA